MMALAVYPSTPKPSYSYMLEHGLKTDVINFETGWEQRNRRWRFPKRTVKILYKFQSFDSTGRDAISDFFYQRYGSYDTFWFFDFQSRKWIDQYMGRGDGATQTFDIPGTMATAVTLNVIDHILFENSDKILAENGDYIVGDGSMVAVGASPPIIYVNGVATTNFNYSTGTGEGGVDQIILGDTPAFGDLITCDFTGYVRIKGRFQDDRFSEELVTKDLDNLAVNIYEVKF